MSTGRSRNAAQTRADILDAARRRFGSDGYQSTTLRAVAADVGIDPALIIRYFGTKQELFAEAAEFTINLPDLTALDHDEIADALLSRFFAVWEQDTTFVALLRAAMTSETAADTLAQGIRHAGGTRPRGGRPRSPRSARRPDGRPRHRLGHDAVRAGQPGGGQSQPGRADPLDPATDPSAPGRPLLGVIPPLRPRGAPSHTRYVTNC